MRARVVAVSMMKDEADVVVACVERVLSQGVDRVIVADNGSTDGTRDLLADLARRAPVEVVDDPDPRFLQGEKLSALAKRAWRERGARWILPLDADEWWTLPRRLPWLGPRVRSTPFLQHLCTGLDDPAEPNPFRRMRYRAPTWDTVKVIVRWRSRYRLDNGSHKVRRRGAEVAASPLEGLEVRNFGVRSLEHMARKLAQGKRAMDAAGAALSEEVGSHWRAGGAVVETGDASAIRAYYESTHFVQDPSAALVLDPVLP